MATPLFHGKYIAPGRLVGAASNDASVAVRRLLARVAEEVAELPTITIREMFPVLAAAEAELERELAVWLKTVPDGALRFTSHQRRVMLRQIRQAMATIASIEPTLAQSLVDGVVRAAGLSNRVLSMEMARLSAAFEGTMPALDLPTISRLMEANNWLINHQINRAKRYTRNAQAAIRAQIAIGVAKGESVDALVSRLMRLQKGVGGSVTLVQGSDKIAGGVARGLFGKVFTDAERLIRTELMNAYNAHHVQSISDAGLLKRLDASSDRHCRLCAAVDGEVREPGEAFSSGHQHAPIHPYCRCVVTPWSPEWPEVKPLESGPGAPVVTRGGTAAETNRVRDKRARRAE